MAQSNRRHAVYCTHVSFVGRSEPDSNYCAVEGVVAWASLTAMAIDYHYYERISQCCTMSVNMSQEGSASEDASTRSSNGSRSSSDADLDRSTTAPAPKPSPFRSMLGSGGVSGTLALTGRLERLRKLDNTQHKESSGGLRREGSGLVPRLGRGKRLRGGAKARPPIQHSESLSSGERTQGSSERDINMASGDDVMSPASSNGQGFLSSPGEVTKSSSDDDPELDSPRRRTNARNGGSGGVPHSKSLLSSGKAVSHASQLKRGLLRLTGRTSRQPPVPRVSTSSNSSSATSEEEGGGEQEDLAEFATSPGRSVATPESSLLDSNLGKKGQLSRGGAPRRGLGRTKQDEGSSPGQPRTTGSRGGGGGGSTGRSSRSGVESPHRRHGWGVPSWRRLVGGLGGWGSLDDAGDNEVAPVSGVGRPAAGMVENVMYGWFGGIVGRTWPRAGLALRPVVDDEDAKQVNSFLASMRSDKKWGGRYGASNVAWTDAAEQEMFQAACVGIARI